MGGRVAEEIVFRDPSTGPANDIQQATKTARAMVTDYGMSDRIGMVKLGDADTEAFGHGSGEGPRAFSDETAAIIDEEVRRLLDNAMREAWRILSENRSVLDTLASRLLEEETLDEAQLAEIFKDVVKAPERPVWNYQSDAAVPGARLGNPVGVSSAQASAPDALPDALHRRERHDGHHAYRGRGAIVTYDAAAVEKASRDLLIAIGEDPEREGLIGTPDRMGTRVARNVLWPVRGPP